MLYEVMLEFWAFWFRTETVQLPDNWLTLLALISTLGLVYFCMIRPILKLIKGRD